MADHPAKSSKPAILDAVADGIYAEMGMHEVGRLFRGLSSGKVQNCHS